MMKGKKPTPEAQNPDPVGEGLERRLETKIFPFLRQQLFNNDDNYDI